MAGFAAIAVANAAISSGASEASLTEMSTNPSPVAVAAAAGVVTVGAGSSMTSGVSTGKTYPISDVKIPERGPGKMDPLEDLSRAKVMTKNKGKVLHHTAPAYPVHASFGHSFVGAAYDAYSSHYHLVMRPDDVWLAIDIAFALYVDKHAEEMRKAFVNHDGKKKLVVVAAGCIQSANWDGIIAKFSDLIDENTKAGIRNWLEPNFSTTTPKDRLVGRVLLMGAMKNYFAYHSMLCCGLPSITLEGTLDDWVQLRARADKLQEYAAGFEGSKPQPDLLKWYRVLVPILDKFVETYKGNVDKKFWNGICDYHGGSGTSDVSGWILAFTPFKEGVYRLRPPAAILAGADYGRVDASDVGQVSNVEVPVTIDDNGTEYSTIFYTGALFSSFSEEKKEIRPSYDWAMIDVTASEKAKAGGASAPKKRTEEDYEDMEPEPTLSRSGGAAEPAPEESINLPAIHAHPLFYVDQLPGHRCDVCKKSYLRESYRCFTCDFDYCLGCKSGKPADRMAWVDE